MPKIRYEIPAPEQPGERIKDPGLYWPTVSTLGFIARATDLGPGPKLYAGLYNNFGPNKPSTESAAFQLGATELQVRRWELEFDRWCRHHNVGWWEQ